MPVNLLTSKTNPVVKLTRAVIDRSRRAHPDLVSAEGIRILEEATRSGCFIEAVLVSEAFGKSPREHGLLDAWEARNTKVYRATSRLLDSLSEVRTHQGAIALVRLPPTDLELQCSSGPQLILCACNIQDPGNLGTLIRTAAGAGATLVVTTPGTVSARSAKCVRASAGAVFYIPLVEQVTPDRMRVYCKSRAIRLYRAAAHAGQPYFDVNLYDGAALILGNEGSGAADENWPDVTSVHIPMSPGVESINVAAAGAVLFFEAHRQRTLSSNGAR